MHIKVDFVGGKHRSEGGTSLQRKPNQSANLGPPEREIAISIRCRTAALKSKVNRFFGQNNDDSMSKCGRFRPSRTFRSFISHWGLDSKSNLLRYFWTSFWELVLKPVPGLVLYQWFLFWVAPEPGHLVFHWKHVRAPPSASSGKPSS